MMFAPDRKLTLKDYDFNDNGRVAAARHCDRLRRFIEAIGDASGAEAVEMATIALYENQTNVARLAGLSRSRLSELKRKKKPTKADRNALIAAFVRRWIV